jgi:hypothetical protein
MSSQGSVCFDSARPDEFLLYQRSVAGPESNGPRLVTVGPEQPSFAYAIPMSARGIPSVAVGARNCVERFRGNAASA